MIIGHIVSFIMIIAFGFSIFFFGKTGDRMERLTVNYFDKNGKLVEAVRRFPSGSAASMQNRLAVIAITEDKKRPITLVRLYKKGR